MEAVCRTKNQVDTNYNYEGWKEPLGIAVVLVGIVAAVVVVIVVVIVVVAVVIVVAVTVFVFGNNNVVLASGPIRAREGG